MASSGIINGNQSGTQPYLRVSWTTLTQEIANNRSRVRLDLILVATHSLHFSASKTGANNGSSFTYTGGFSGTGTRLLNRREIWVNHNSDGTRTQSVSGSFNIAVTWSGSWLGSLSVSGNMNLDTIPRASSLNSFSIGSHLQPDSSNTVNLSISRASGSFTHDIQLRDGSTVLQSWNGQGLPSSLTISSGTVNTLLNRMSSVSARSLTLRVQTKSGSSNIGNAVTRTATATVHSNVQPSSSVPTASISGSGRDSTISRYVQNVSRVAMSASTYTAGYGASVSTRRLIIRHSSGADVERSEYSSTSATSPTLRRSGTYNIYSLVTDSRGRSFTSDARTISVEAYSEPRISTFSTSRREATPTAVDISRAGNHSPISGSLNTLTILVQKRQGTGSWTTVQSTSTTSSSFSGTATSKNNSVTQSYEFRIVITDTFGNRAEANATVSTQRVVLDIHKNEGVGIGKIHEQGVLDVDGQIITNGRVDIVPNVDGSDKSDPIRIFSQDDNGHGYIEYWGADGQRKGYIGVPTSTQNFIEFRSEHGTDSVLRLGNGYANLVANDVRINGDTIIASGNNSNGNWVRYSDGTQICWKHEDIGVPAFAPGEYSGTHNIGSYAAGFVGEESVNVVAAGYSSGGARRSQMHWTSGYSNGVWNPGNFVIENTELRSQSFTCNRISFKVIAIGRWK